MDLSKHDSERNRIIADWVSLPSFVCDGCRSEYSFPQSLSIMAEARYANGLRADIGAVDLTGRLVGVVEVIDTSRPTPRAFEEHSKLDFAYYCLLNLPRPPRHRRVDDEIANGRFRYPTVEAGCNSGPAWFCSEDCLTFIEALREPYDGTNGMHRVVTFAASIYTPTRSLGLHSLIGVMIHTLLTASTVRHVVARVKCSGVRQGNWLVGTHANGHLAPMPVL